MAGRTPAAATLRPSVASRGPSTGPSAASRSRLAPGTRTASGLPPRAEPGTSGRRSIRSGSVPSMKVTAEAARRLLVAHHLLAVGDRYRAPLRRCRGVQVWEWGTSSAVRAVLEAYAATRVHGLARRDGNCRHDLLERLLPADLLAQKVRCTGNSGTRCIRRRMSPVSQLGDRRRRKAAIARHQPPTSQRDLVSRASPRPIGRKGQSRLWDAVRSRRGRGSGAVGDPGRWPDR
jgi:hypothetical protein